MRIGLTGGVGSGKSTVAALLAGHGAVVVDSDAIAREVVEPGTPGHQAVVERFGDAVVAADGRLDRPALAAVVFADSEAGRAALAALNAIVHPLVGRRAAELVAAAPADAVVVHDVPLLTENGLADQFDSVLVVETPLALRLERLADRGLPEQQARERIAAQADDAQRRAIADHVIVNDGSREQLARAVDELWAVLAAGPGPGPGDDPGHGDERSSTAS